MFYMLRVWGKHVCQVMILYADTEAIPGLRQILGFFMPCLKFILLVICFIYLYDYLRNIIHSRDYVQDVDYLFGHDVLFVCWVTCYTRSRTRMNTYISAGLSLCQYKSYMLISCLYVYILAYDSLIWSEVGMIRHSLWLLVLWNDCLFHVFMTYF